MTERRSDDRWTHRALIFLVTLGSAGLLLQLAWAAGLGRGEINTFVNNQLYDSIEGIAAAALILRAVRSPGERWIWAPLGCGLAFWMLGDIYWSLELAGVKNIPYPSIADALYLAGYPCFYVGVIALVRRRVTFHPSTWIDGLIGGLAAAALAAALLAPALVGLTDGDPGTVATNLAYPLGDLLLLAFLVGGAIAAGGRLERAWLPVSLGLALTAIADCIYLYVTATGFYSHGFLDSLWLTSAVVLAAATLVPLRGKAREESRGASMFFPAVFALIAVGILGWDQIDPVGAVSGLLAVATLCAVVVRLALSARENAALLHAVREDSITDALTGLGNRRAVLRDLGHVLEQGEPKIFAMFDLDGFKGYNDAFGHPAGDLLLRRVGNGLAAAVEPSGRAYRLGGDEFCVIADQRGWKTTMLARAHLALSESGKGFHVTASSGYVALPAEAETVSAALGTADARMYAHKGSRPNSAQSQAHDVLLSLLREREPALTEHVQGVAGLALKMGIALRIDNEDLDVLVRAAELHDIGKVAIPDRIVHKPGPLDESEWELMRSHTVIGERILAAAPAMEPVARLVRASHEYWDGSGYPDELAGKDITLGARIILVCDAFEAMTTDRAYRPASIPADAIEELRRCAGTQFDPDLVELFVREVFPQRASEPVVAAPEAPQPLSGRF